MFYFSYINSVGGIETFFYQIAKKFKNKDITILYKAGDAKQLERLSEYVNCVKYTGQAIKCKTMYYNLNIDIIDNVTADNHIQILHGDYKALNAKPCTSEKITDRISVSNVVSESFEEITGIRSRVIYNPYEVEKPRKVLKLLTASRLTKEKGKDRMIKLANELDRCNIPFIWYLYSDNQDRIHNNIITLPPTLDLIDYINDVDYLVQLSDTEGFCYSIVEALSVNTPVITTDISVLKEIGVNEQNGIILKLDMSNLDVKEIYNRAGEFNFKYTPPISEWGKEIKANKTKYKKVRKLKYIVTANEKWEEMKIINTDMGRIPKKGEKWEVEQSRLDKLMGNNDYNINFIESFEKVKSDLTISELKAIAKEQNIKGYTKMNKKELEKAISHGNSNCFI